MQKAIMGPDTDLSYFKNRFAKIKEETVDSRGKPYSYNSIAKALLEKKLLSQYREMDLSDEKQFTLAQDNIKHKVTIHAKEETADNISGEYLLAYSELFRCSVEYLLGLTYVPCQDKETRHTCEKTHLSPEAITKLMEAPLVDGYPSPVHKCWSALIESDLFETFLYDFAMAMSAYEKYISVTTGVQILEEAIRNATNSPIAADLMGIRVKGLENEIEERYAAYHGILYRVTNKMMSVLEELMFSEEQIGEIRKKAEMDWIQLRDQFLTADEQVEAQPPSRAGKPIKFTPLNPVNHKP